MAYTPPPPRGRPPEALRAPAQPATVTTEAMPVRYHCVGCGRDVAVTRFRTVRDETRKAWRCQCPQCGQFHLLSEDPDVKGSFLIRPLHLSVVNMEERSKTRVDR
jgi:DNA-directed RNA polymerase subunit RPC12/RpoP